MNVLLQKHGAKHIYKVPEGLRELCADIAREVLRSQPRNIYCFVADYVEALLITRENAKVAVKVVNDILLGSQDIVDILRRSGLSLEQIARAAPRIQTAFREYLDAVDMRAAQVYDDTTCDERSKVSLRSILQEMGVSLEQAEKYTTIIQTAFRAHYKKMLLNESRGMIQQTRSLEILGKAGVSQAEASKAAILIQATYRGYCTRRNLKMKMKARQEEKEESGVDIIELREAVQSVNPTNAELEIELTRTNRAASTIQRAYRQYRQKKSEANPIVKPTRSMVVQAILNNLCQKIFDEIIARADIPMEFGDRENLTEASEELQRVFEDRLIRARLASEDEETLIHVEELESLENLLDNGIYSIGVMEDRQEDRRVEIEPERDEETYTQE